MAGDGLEHLTEEIGGHVVVAGAGGVSPRCRLEVSQSVIFGNRGLGGVEVRFGDSVPIAFGPLDVGQ